jgi:hypothetical protein
LPVVRQAGSRDPVRRSSVETDRETAIQKIAGRLRDTAGGRCSEGRLAEGNTRKPAVLGIAPVRQGRRPVKVANPGGAESVQVGTTPKLEGARESDRPTGHNRTRPSRTEPRLEVPSVRLPPSDASPLLSGGRSRAKAERCGAEAAGGESEPRNQRVAQGSVNLARRTRLRFFSLVVLQRLAAGVR